MKVIDMHCDTIMSLCESKKKDIHLDLRENNLMISLSKMHSGDYLAQCFAMFVPFKVENPFETCMEMIDRYYLELDKNQDIIAKALSYDDILQNSKNNKMSAILTIEEGGVTKCNLAFLRNFYRLGVRMITLTWNFINGVGYPNFVMPTQKGLKPDMKTPNTNDGLTPYGIEMVKEMNRLGIIIDVSHLSDKGFYDVCQYSNKPFVASHSNSRTQCNHVRNLTDEMLLALKKNGGVAGINYCADFINDDKGENNFTYVKDLVKHIKHIVKIAGIDHVGLGSDFDGIGGNIEMDDASKLPMLEKELIENGFSEEEIAKIFSLNVLRVFKEVLI